MSFEDEFSWDYDDGCSCNEDEECSVCIGGTQELVDETDSSESAAMFEDSDSGIEFNDDIGFIEDKDDEDDPFGDDIED